MRFLTEKDDEKAVKLFGEFRPESPGKAKDILRPVQKMLSKYDEFKIDFSHTKYMNSSFVMTICLMLTTYQLKKIIIKIKKDSFIQGRILNNIKMVHKNVEEIII